MPRSSQLADIVQLMLGGGQRVLVQRLPSCITLYHYLLVATRSLFLLLGTRIYVVMKAQSLEGQTTVMILKYLVTKAR